MEAGEEEGGREVCFYAGKESFFLSLSLCSSLRLPSLEEDVSPWKVESRAKC